MLASQAMKRMGLSAILCAKRATTVSALYAGSIAPVATLIQALIASSLALTGEVLATSAAQAAAMTTKTQVVKNGVCFGTLSAKMVSITLLAVCAHPTASMAR